MSDHLPTPVLEGLADTLWQERHMVERLLYRMVTARLLLAADEHRFVAVAIDEVEDVVTALRRAESDRLAAVQEVADQLQVPVEDLSLSDVIRLAPPALQPVFTDHRTAFLALTAEIEESVVANRVLAANALEHLQWTRWSASRAGRTRIGHRVVEQTRACMDLQVMETAYRATLPGLGRPLPDTLVTLLR